MDNKTYIWLMQSKLDYLAQLVGRQIGVYANLMRCYRLTAVKERNELCVWHMN